MSLSKLSILGQTTLGVHAREDLLDWVMGVNDYDDPDEDFEDEEDDWDADMALSVASG
jgi:hypothetical protein